MLLSFLEEMMTFKETPVPIPLAIRLLRQWAPRIWNSPGSLMIEAWCQPEVEFISQEEISHSSNNFARSKRQAAYWLMMAGPALTRTI